MGLKSQARKKAIHLMLVYTGGCNGCDIEQYNVYLTWNPREADVLVVSGPVTYWTKEPLLKIYEAIPKPKLVVAVGACALTGGVYKNIHGEIPSEEIEGPVDNVIPVDAKIPGCAVRPEDVVAGVVSVIPILLGKEDK